MLKDYVMYKDFEALSVKAENLMVMVLQLPGVYNFVSESITREMFVSLKKESVYQSLAKRGIEYFKDN